MTTIAVLADLHLTNGKNTVQYLCFKWALNKLKEIQPDLIVLAGDMTAFQNPKLSESILKEIGLLGIPYISAPGNTERRKSSTETVLKDVESFSNHECIVLAVDSSDSTIPEKTRKSIINQIKEAKNLKAVIVTHMPVSGLKEESRKWFKTFLDNANISLLVTAHRHLDETGSSGFTKCIGIRGMDPEKAIGAPPAIAVFKMGNSGWEKSDFAYPDATVDAWNKSERKDFLDHLGLAFLNEDEILTDMDFAISQKISCVELRNCAVNINRKKLAEKIFRWRQNGKTFLSWHLPDIEWDSGKKSFKITEEWRKTMDAIEELGGQMVTMHPLCLPVGVVKPRKAIYDFACRCSDLLLPLKERNITIGIENLHMKSTEQDNDYRRFGYLPDELQKWRHELSRELQYNIGLVLDLGHARNNKPYSCNYTLGKWFSITGQDIIAYHLHQVLQAPGGKKKNHCPVENVFGPLISFGAFFCAWKKNLINHCPIFIEVRGYKNRLKTYSTFREYLKL